MSPSPHHDQASSSHHVQPPTPAKPCWLLTLPVFNISAHAGPELTIIAATTKATVANQSMRLMLSPPPSVAGNPLNKRVAPYSSKDAYGTPFGAAYWRNYLSSRGGSYFVASYSPSFQEPTFSETHREGAKVISTTVPRHRRKFARSARGGDEPRILRLAAQ